MSLNKINSFIPRSNLLIISIFFVIALLFRIIAIHVPLTTDETLWLSRGHDFITGLLAGNLKETYQKHHPGVITMWIIGISEYLNMWILKLFPETFNSWLQYPLECLNNEPSYCPINAYIMPRVIQGIITSACMGGFYWFNQELFGRWRAILATCFLLFSPFFLGYQRFITTDALQIDFCILALLSFLLYLFQNQKIKFLLLTGFFLALGILSKVPALFYLPIIIFIIIIKEFKFSQNFLYSIGWIKTSFHLLLFILTLLLTLFCFWPILWNVFEYNYVFTAIFDTHLPGQATRTGMYFLGNSKEYPNILFYLFVLAYRLSPLIQFGLLALIISFIFKPLKAKLLYKKKLIILAIFAVIPLVIFSLIPSKIDRYILLIYPQLICLATAGWFNIISYLTTLKIRLVDVVITSKLYLILLITIAFSLVISCFPYYVSFYNPLFGGTKVAVKMIMLGNGEGLDQVGQWLNKQKNAENLTVLSWYDTVTGSYFKGKTLKTYGKNKNLKLWLNKTDYIILYVNQIQRNYNRDWLKYLSNQEPVYVVELNGVEYAKVYAVFN